MTDLSEQRRAIRRLLRPNEPGDAMATYYALYHPDEKTRLVIHPADGSAATGYVALSRTGIDLFRPLVTMRLPLGRDADGAAESVALLRAALAPEHPVILSAPSDHAPLIRALFDVQTEERLHLYALDPLRFEPVINVLVVQSTGPGDLPRFTMHSGQGGAAEVVASAAVNWMSPQFAEIAVSTQPSFRRRGWGRSVTASLCHYLLDSGRTPLYVVSADNAPSIQLAEGLGFVDTGAREVMFQAALKPA